RLEGLVHDGFGQLAGGVVAAGAAPLEARLDDEGARSRSLATVGPPFSAPAPAGRRHGEGLEGGEHLLFRLRSARGGGDLPGDGPFTAELVGEPGGAASGGHREQRLALEPGACPFAPETDAHGARREAL